MLLMLSVFRKKTLPRLRQNHQKLSKWLLNWLLNRIVKIIKPVVARLRALKKQIIYCVFLKMATKEPKQLIN